MAKQTGLLEVICKMTVKNVMGESSGCLPVAVHMSLFLLMKTILIARLTSLHCIRTQAPCSYKLLGASELSRFRMELLIRAVLVGREGRWHWWLSLLLRSFCHHIWDNYWVLLFFPVPVYHRSLKSEGAALISNALTRHASAVLCWWDVTDVWGLKMCYKGTLLARNSFLWTERACPSALCSSFWSSFCDSDNGPSSL